MQRLPGYAVGVPIEHDRRQPHEVGEHGPDVDAGVDQLLEQVTGAPVEMKGHEVPGTQIYGYAELFESLVHAVILRKPLKELLTEFLEVEFLSHSSSPGNFYFEGNDRNA